MCVEVRSQNREKVQLKYLLWVGVPAPPTVNMSELSLVSLSPLSCHCLLLRLILHLE